MAMRVPSAALAEVERESGLSTEFVRQTYAMMDTMNAIRDHITQTAGIASNAQTFQNTVVRSLAS